MVWNMDSNRRAFWRDLVGLPSVEIVAGPTSGIVDRGVNDRNLSRGDSPSNW